MNPGLGVVWMEWIPWGRMEPGCLGSDFSLAADYGHSTAASSPGHNFLVCNTAGDGAAPTSRCHSEDHERLGVAGRVATNREWLEKQGRRRPRVAATLEPCVPAQLLQHPRASHFQNTLPCISKALTLLQTNKAPNPTSSHLRDDRARQTFGTLPLRYPPPATY